MATPTYVRYGLSGKNCEDSFAWLRARAFPWAPDDCGKDDTEERRYWAGEWEQKYESYLVFASLAMTPYPREERWNRFCTAMSRARYVAVSREASQAAEEVMMGRT